MSGVIDSFNSSAGHVLKDLAKFENDLLYLLTPLAGAGELAEALTLTRALRSVVDLRAHWRTSRRGALPPSGEGVAGARGLRGLARSYAMTTAALCSFRWRCCVTRSTPWVSRSRRSCRGTAPRPCSLADQIAETMEAEQTLRVDWIDTELLPLGRLGITVCPGRRDRGRDLGADVARLRAEGADQVLCLLTDTELLWAGVGDLAVAGSGRYRLPAPACPRPRNTRRRRRTGPG